MNKKEYKENIRKELKETFPNEIEHIWSFGYCNRINLKDDKYYEKVLNFLKSNNSIYKDIKNYCSMIQFDIIIPEEFKSDIDKEIELLENKLKELKLKRKNMQLQESKLKKKKELEEELKRINEELK